MVEMLGMLEMIGEGAEKKDKFYVYELLQTAHHIQQRPQG